MPRYEYRLVPAPEKAAKHKGLKGAASFAATLEDILNELGQDGWHYLRADTLPQEERAGLTGKVTTYRNLLVFQRVIPDPVLETTPAEPTRTRRRPPPDLDEAEDETEENVSLANLFVDPDEPRETTERSGD